MDMLRSALMAFVMTAAAANNALSQAPEPPAAASLPPNERPHIAVTGPDSGGETAWLFTAAALERAGATPHRITPNRAAVANLEFDGLVIGGGADVDPAFYVEGAPPLLPPADAPHFPPERFAAELMIHPLVWLSRNLLASQAPPAHDDTRDQLELALIDRALARRVPVLGICRGEQLLNVALGGTLFQNLRSFYQEDSEVRTVLPRIRITVAPDSKLYSIMSSPHHLVNALHHEAVDTLGNGLRRSAVDDHGVIEAIEHETLPWVIGVQWHPEYLPEVPVQHALFRSLVTAARCAKSGRTHDPAC